MTSPQTAPIPGEELKAEKVPDLIAAIAPVVGGMAPAMAKKFHPDHTVSILVIQGDADPLVPIRGGMVGFPRGRK